MQFDPDGGLPAFVRIHLERLRPLASELVLVSNSPMAQAARTDAEHLCNKVILRENIGLDFAGWRDALSHYDTNQWDEVVLTNSSIVGPLFPLAPIFEEMDSRDCDFWGMVHSRHRGSHLQSYFLSFSDRVIRSEAWRDFWRNVEDEPAKKKIIQRYEVGISQTLMENGFTFATFVEDLKFPDSIRLVHINRLRSHVLIPFNANYVNKTVELHHEFLEQGMPYLKASLLWGKDTYLCKPVEKIKSVSGIEYPWEEIGC